MTTPRHFCQDGGYLVSGEFPVGGDPADYQAGAAILGCNRLRCVKCAEMVRQHPGIRVSGGGAKLWARLFATSDWAASQDAEPDPTGRLYACRCTGRCERNYQTCIDTDPESRTSHDSPPWSCDGHPIAVLPITLDGETISADMDWRAFVARVLGGWSPSSAPPPSPWSPSAWLYRVRKILEDRPEAVRLGEAAAQCLGDPVRRAGALAYFCGFPRDPSFPGVLALARVSRELVRRTSTVVIQKTSIEYWPAKALRCRLFSVRGALDPTDTAALTILQDALLRGEAGLEREDLDAVRCVAPDWLAEQAGHIARGNAVRTIEILESLGDLEQPALLATAGVRLAREPAADHAALREWCSGWAHRSREYAAAILAVLDG